MQVCEYEVYVAQNGKDRRAEFAFNVRPINIPQGNKDSLSSKGGRGCLMFLSCLESQGCHLIPLSYLLSSPPTPPSPLALSVFFGVFFLLLMVPSPFFFYQNTLKYFSLRVRLFCMALVEQLGDDSR